jgi:hypothetical protein
MLGEGILTPPPQLTPRPAFPSTKLKAPAMDGIPQVGVMDNIEQMFLFVKRKMEDG